MTESTSAKEWTILFMKEFAKESDRAFIIIAATMLDSALESTIKRRLAPTPSPEDSLLEGVNAPISSFSAKIDLAHRLGIISTKFCRDLHLVRKIRKEVAHNIKAASFDDRSIRGRVDEFVRSSGWCDKSATARETAARTARGKFQTTVSWMLYHLWCLSEEIKSMEPAELEFGYRSLSESEDKEG